MVRAMQTASDFQSFRLARTQALDLRLEDFEESFHRSSGPGGQNVNKVSTAVTVSHLPTGTGVTAQDTRSQAQNRQLAWERIFEAIEADRDAKLRAVKDAKEKTRRQTAKRPWKVKQRMLASKKRRSDVKKMRAKSF